MPITRDTDREVVIKVAWLNRAPGWVLMLLGIFLALVSILGGLAEGDVGAFFVCAGFSVWAFLSGYLLVRTSTHVTFDRPPGHMARRWKVGRWPPYFFKTQRIPRGQAKGVFVRSVARFPYSYVASYGTAPSGESQTTYQVRVKTDLGQDVVLHEDFNKRVADHLAKRISEFSERPIT